MKRVVWTRQAVEDVEAIRSYVARDSERYTILLVERLVAAVERAGHFPEPGRVVPEVGDAALREIVYGSYRIVYRLTAEAVEIATPPRRPTAETVRSVGIETPPLSAAGLFPHTIAQPQTARETARLLGRLGLGRGIATRRRLCAECCYHVL